MSRYDEHYRFRSELTERLLLDVLGPLEGSDEILSDPPVSTYLMGVLFPLRRSEEVVEDSEEADVDLAGPTLEHDEQPDIGVSMANRQSPSSMGLTCTVDAVLCKTLKVAVTTAAYEAIDASGNLVEAVADAARSTEDSSVRWRRTSIEPAPVPINILEPGVTIHSLTDGLEVRAQVRHRDSTGGTVTVTVTVVNVHETQAPLRDPWCFFQCFLSISTDPARPAILEQRDPLAGDDESLTSYMLYRHAPTFAVGHGCAADWKLPAPSDLSVTRPDGRRSISEVRSSFAPVFDVLLSESNMEIDTARLRMIDLATDDSAKVLGSLRGMVDGYRQWVQARETDAADMQASPFGAVALEQVRHCRKAYERMSLGIDLLARDPAAMRAFRLANEAMALQRARALLVRGEASSDEALRAGVWRPFQLGFILLCLEGLADSDHPDRGIADLLWFPTGGGKTEAYLGLVAFSVFIRRIRLGVAGGGVTVLMRYTLRLLTLQQFERAATLMCAMDTLRRREGDLSDEEISIGMWVGASATPNSLQDAEKGIKEMREHKKLREKNPVQLRRCPWCGIDIDASNYRVDWEAQRVVVACASRDCEFQNGLPVHLVDESVYHHRPTLVIATVDKFAQMTWKAEPAALFNKVGGPAGTPPPQLIIQDELHLISGPLGTLVGLYEAALDIVADRPKVIASTATIRRAREQGKALFDRDVQQFPPSGLDARDSWFAVEADSSLKASRRYVGLFAPNTSQATLLVRSYGALLHHASVIDGRDEIRDSYWTLVGYFNSLRLLAAAELQVNDDVAGRLKKLAGDGAQRIVESTELTSRVDASDIPLRLRQLDMQHPRPEALDVVLATNMISVGVDVDRLGLMAVTGQPQTTAEYIQATSRVGRRDPGLVVVLYNAARSRDRSHFENFRSYHAALYRQVESTSVTPFSARARDRALHAVLIGAARLSMPEARSNEAAGDLSTFLPQLRDLAARIVDRVRRLAPDEVEAAAAHLDRIIGEWSDMAEWNKDLVYHKPKWAGDQTRRPDFAALLRDFGEDDLPYSFPTMSSLRDVDVETDLQHREGRR